MLLVDNYDELPMPKKTAMNYMDSVGLELVVYLFPGRDR